jgi:hypothetical protein
VKISDLEVDADEITDKSFEYNLVKAYALPHPAEHSHGRTLARSITQ